MSAGDARPTTAGGRLGRGGSGSRPGRPVLLGLVAAAGVLAAVHLGSGRSPGPRPLPAPHAGAPVVITGAGAAGAGAPMMSSPPSARRPGPRAASLAFVGAYAAFVYGRLASSQVPGASPYVRRQLDAQRPRPPAAVLAVADPRLRSLAVTPSGRGRARAVAVIEDGAAVYQLTLELRLRSAGWAITGLGENG